MLTQKDFESWDLWNEFCDRPLRASARVAKMKKKLKRMYDDGESRPQQNIKEGQCLKRYTDPSSSSYDLAFRESLPKWFIFVAEKKEELRKMYNNGEPKPHWSTREAKNLYMYTCPGSATYSQKFREELSRWCPKLISTAEKKKKLKRMHDDGEAKPHYKSKEGQILLAHTIPSSNGFDLVFRESLSRWFIDSAAEMKKELKRMHDDGEEKPHYKSKEGKSLSNYINSSSVSFDLKFRETVPTWLIKRNPVAEMKKKLKSMYDNGEEKPRKSTREGQALRRYTLKGGKCFDLEFKKSLPRWFVTLTMKRKKKFLRMAKKSEDKSNLSSNLAHSFYQYITPGSKSYDPIFREQIKSIRPIWLLTKLEKTKKRKRQLLKMAKNGENKPEHGSILARAFYTFTYNRKTTRSYCPDFVAEIKKLAPDWLPKGQRKKK